MQNYFFLVTLTCLSNFLTYILTVTKTQSTSYSVKHWLVSNWKNLSKWNAKTYKNILYNITYYNCCLVFCNLLHFDKAVQLITSSPYKNVVLSCFGNSCCLLVCKKLDIGCFAMISLHWEWNPYIIQAVCFSPRPLNHAVYAVERC